MSVPGGESNIPVGLSHQPWPVLNGTDEETTVNKVEAGVFIAPFVFNIVNNELEIWRHPVHKNQEFNHIGWLLMLFYWREHTMSVGLDLDRFQ